MNRYKIIQTAAGYRIYDYEKYDLIRNEKGKFVLFKPDEEKKAFELLTNLRKEENS